MRSLADHPEFTILIVHSEWHEVDAMGTRPFVPVSYSLVTGTQIRTRTSTNVEDFRTRYAAWFDGNTEAFEYTDTAVEPSTLPME